MLLSRTSSSRLRIAFTRNQTETADAEFADPAQAPAGRQIELLAREVRAAFPERVREDAHWTLSVSSQEFTAVLLQAVKKQQALIDAQAKDLAAQKSGERCARRREVGAAVR